MYIRQSVVKPVGKSPAASAPKEPNLVVVATDDILTWPMRDSKGVKIIGNYVVKTGAKMIEVYTTPSKSKASFESEGDEDAVSITQKYEAEHPGNELEIAEFVQNWLGVNCMLIYGSCSDKFRKVLGSKCAPMQLKASLQDDNDARKHMLVFEQSAKSAIVPGHYTGALSFGDPYQIADAGAVAVTEVNGNIYKVPALAITEEIIFTALSLPSGSIVTLVGSGGVAPATLSSALTDKGAMLTDGADWVALDGATINLQVFDAGATTHLIELSRS